ncbi:somatostatin receptor type 2-like [Tubulanus polymorphus]|uniref:somatostatin receptor type 2-like n=1 Tax=Tubulanus polymorphus TaxID=672921 RepID=UPI003DA5B833
MKEIDNIAATLTTILDKLQNETKYGNFVDPMVAEYMDDDGYFYYSGDIDNIAKPWLREPIFIPALLIYGVTFLLGFVGNAIVVLVILLNRKSRSVTTLFLVSLALADVLFLTICVPCELVRFFTTHWHMGETFCKIFAFTEMFTTIASITNMVAMSLERYIVIVHPMRARSWFTIGRTKIIILSVWLLSVALSLPAVAVQGSELTNWYKGSTKVSILLCVDHVDSKWRIVYAWYQLCILFALPTFIMAFCYSIVVYVLWVSTRQLAKMTTSQSKKYERNGSCSDDESRHRLASNTYSNVSLGGSQRGASTTSRGAREHSAVVQKARKQVIKMLITVVVIFLVCWGPKLIFAVLIRYRLQFLYEDESFPIVKGFIYLLPYVQSCVNPIVYGFMSSNFQRGLRHVCRAYVCHRRVYELCFGRGRTSDYELETKTNGTTSHTMLMSRYSQQTERKISSRRIQDNNIDSSEYESIKLGK